MISLDAVSPEPLFKLPFGAGYEVQTSKNIQQFFESMILQPLVLLRQPTRGYHSQTM